MKKYTHYLTGLLLGTAAALSTGCQHYGEDNSQKTTTQTANAFAEGQLFGWPFAEGDESISRGGTTKGGSVVVDLQTSPGWRMLQEKGLSSFERDRRAVLAMVGDFRVSFQFVEVAGMESNYSQKKPYFSWTTERVTILEDKGDFISLQHTLVMFIEQKDGSVNDPILVKHWRQDWSYEDTHIHAYTSKLQWTERTLAKDEVTGQWSQTVYQVDDSPRYEVVGKWIHGPQLSVWQSNFGKRPMPRREFSVREDYDLLQGWNTVTIYPTGWLHEQSNFKLALEREEQDSRYIAKETGINRYDRIRSPNLDEATAYWKRTGAYWKAVRDIWSDIYAKNSKFSLLSKVDGEKLYEVHFAYAKSIQSADEYNEVAGHKHAQETINKFLVTSETASPVLIEDEY